MRIALVLELSPRKLGSLEDWIVRFAHAAGRRGHTLAVFGSGPVHPVVHRELATAGTRWVDLDELAGHPFRAVRRLARDFDVIHLNLFAPRDRVPCLAYAAWPAQVIFVDHFSDHPLAIPRYRLLPRKALNIAATLRVAKYIGVSNYVRDRARSRCLGGRRLAETVYGGVDVARFTPGLRQADGVLRLICVANLIREKGVDLLLRAMAMLDSKAVQLTVVGDGPEEANLQMLAAGLGLDTRVRFLGLRDDVERLLGQSDIYVHPARWQEAFGLTVAEALACGCAVVAAAVGAMPELIEDGVSGMLVPPDDPEALARALEVLIARPDTRATMCTNARARVVERFRIEGSVERHLDCCEEVVR